MNKILNLIKILNSKTLFGLFAASFFISLNSSAQIGNDQAEILQSIVDLNELQSYYPLNPDNSTKPLVIMQHGISFPNNIPVTHNNNTLLFKEKSEIEGEDAYYLFWTYNIKPASAMVEFIYNYNVGSPNGAGQKGLINFEKVNNVWTISSSNIQTVQL